MKKTNKRKIALIGANGQLATDILKIAKEKKSFIFFPLTHTDIEISNPKSVEKTLNYIAPDIILNAAAYNRVEIAEANLKPAFLVNAFATKYLANYTKQKDCVLVHISTDYVFGLDEERNIPYREIDPPGPVNIYGLSKLTGEYFVQQACSKYFIIRSSGLFGTAQSSSKGYNLVELMLKLAREKGKVRVVNDQITAPTYTLDLARQILTILEKAPFGLYHATAQGQCSHYEFAKEIFRLTNQPVDLKAVTSKEFGAIARRPHYSVLSNEKLKKHGLYLMLKWRDGLKAYLKEKGYI